MAARRAVSAAVELPAIRVATYNIHGCVGLDWRCDPARIASVLREINADIFCLQEVAHSSRNPDSDHAAYLAQATERNVIVGTAVCGRGGRYVNAILTRFQPLATRAIDLAVPGYEPRGAIDVDLMVGDRILRVMATHFGLRAGERRLQADRLIAALRERAPRPGGSADAVVLVGDLNEWRGRAGGVRVLDRCLGPSATPRTFPSWMPVLPLDRIYAFGPAMLRDVRVYRSPLARVASDHLPLVGSLRWTDLEPRALQRSHAGEGAVELRHPARRVNGAIPLRRPVT